ncbi:Aste57867_19092 [Aphanomyces stellatus]|uniref:Aste57867_19092 protein n=1 Tax=Aphanomyces stellatus TaxID=120398 RepID=A0A485LBQ9_9STRA|nr:hypothetical protein As57867_019028 [Aphanomyces stellatus]VFT95817.1 Aste57867_19092 [Aphanomyces stellatus]
MQDGLNDQLVALISDLVRKEVESLFRARDDNVERLNQQVKALIKDVERITMELESRSAWNRSVTKYEAKLSPPSKPPVETSPTKKKTTKLTSFKRLPSLDPAADDDIPPNTRNEDGKLVFAKKLPRVAGIDKSSSAFLTQLSQQAQKQKIYEQAFMRYPECRSTVFAPSSWDPRNISIAQLELPSVQLQLSRVHGYHNTAASNVFYLASGELVWFTATVVLMHAKSKQSQRFYMGHSKEITALTLHPNAQLVASGQCGKDAAAILIWDSKRAKTEPNHVLAKLDGQSVNIRSLSFSHDGKLVASLGGDLYNTICIHDWQEQTLLVKARGGHSSKVWTVAFNPYQAYGMPDKVKLPQKKKPKWETRPVPGQALRDDDACYTLVSCGVQHIKFWTLTQVEYTPPHTVAKASPLEESAFYGSSFGGPNRMRQPTPHEKVWKLEGNPPLMKSEAQDFTCLSFTNDNVPLLVHDDATDAVIESLTQTETTLGRIVAGTAKGDLYVFWQPRKPPGYSSHVSDADVAPRKWWELPVTSWDDANAAIMEHVHFEPTAKLVEIIPHDVATGNRFKISRHAQMELQDVQQRLTLKPDAKPLLERLAQLEYRGQLGHTASCTQVACDGRTGQLATAGADGKVHFWSLQLLDPVRVAGTHTRGVYAPLGGAGTDGRHKLHLERTVALPAKAKATSLSWSSDGALVAGLTNHSIWEYNGAMWTPVTEACEGAVLGGVLMAEQNELVTVTSDYVVRCWDMASQTCVQKLTLRNMGACIAAHPNQRELAVGCTGGEMVLLSYPELGEKKSIRVLATESISVLKYSPDGKYMAVGAKDNCLHIFETESTKKLGKCEGHATFVSHIDWSIDGYLLQTNSVDGEILYWQVTPTAVRQITDSLVMRDILWDQWSCVFGWPVQGIWPESSAASDVAAVTLLDNRVPVEGNHVLVAYRSCLRSFRWPCMKSAQHYAYEGHASSITAVLTWKQRQVVTLGGADGTIMEWTASPEEGHFEEDDEYGEAATSPTPPPRSAENNRPRTPRQMFLKEDITQEEENGSREEEEQQEESPREDAPRKVEDTYDEERNKEMELPSDTALPDKEETIRAGTTTDGIECGRAKFDFQGENPDELSMKEGEVIRILEKREGDWWVGETCDGTRGIFPREYVQNE